MTKTLINLMAFLIITTGLVVTGQAQTLFSHDTPTSEIERMVDETMYGYNLKGLALAIVVGDQVIYSQGYGLADPSGRSLTASTPLTIGSLSKSITALATQQLAEQGKFDLDEPVITRLPWFHTNNKAWSDQITLRHLLNQTSGLSNSLGLQPIYDSQPDFSLEQRLEKLSNYELSRQPGQQFEYSNMNYILLGAVIESVSGQSYAKYVQDKVFTPLAMSNSTARLAEAEENSMATGSYWLFGFPSFTKTPWYQDAVPAGYIIASVEDMSHYLIAQLNGGVYHGNSVLSNEGISEMQSGAVPTGDGQQYGMGWVIGKKANVDAVYHDGDAAGYTSSIIMGTSERIGVIVMTNSSSMLVSPAGDLAVRLFAALHEQSISKAGMTTRSLYSILDILVIGLTSWLILAFIHLPRWWRRLSEWRQKGAGARFTRIFLPIMMDFLWPYILLGFIPQGAGFPMWKVLNVFQPDFSYWLQGMAWAAIIKGLIKITLFFVFIRTHKPPSIARILRRQST